VSLGGRLTLLNAVLSDIPIFFLSFMKLPASVWKEIVRIQRKFLWGGVSDRKRINWVKWETICLPKAEGGLGVRDIRIMNISLLAKWKWRLLQNEDALWVKVLSIKYGASVVSNQWVELVSPSRFDSLWWKDVRSVGGEVDVNSNWFSSSVTRVVSNGRNTRF
jgi:hypothetical protein